jgi:sec-independent protein translocase protein TatA
MFGSFGATEIIIIVVALILLFGGKKIPELAKNLGKGIKEFKKTTKEIQEDNEEKDSKSK